MQRVSLNAASAAVCAPGSEDWESDVFAEDSAEDVPGAVLSTAELVELLCAQHQEARGTANGRTFAWHGIDVRHPAHWGHEVVPAEDDAGEAELLLTPQHGGGASVRLAAYPCSGEGQGEEGEGLGQGEGVALSAALADSVRESLLEEGGGDVAVDVSAVPGLEGVHIIEHRPLVVVAAALLAGDATHIYTAQLHIPTAHVAHPAVRDGCVVLTSFLAAIRGAP